MKEVYILTFEVNEYDQYGEYYKDCWDHLPTITEIIECLHPHSKWDEFGNIVTEDFYNHLIKGGGRIGTQHSWYNLYKKELKN